MPADWALGRKDNTTVLRYFAKKFWWHDDVQNSWYGRGEGGGRKERSKPCPAHTLRKGTKKLMKNRCRGWLEFTSLACIPSSYVCLSICVSAYTCPSLCLDVRICGKPTRNTMRSTTKSSSLEEASRTTTLPSTLSTVPPSFCSLYPFFIQTYPSAPYLHPAHPSPTSLLDILVHVNKILMKKLKLLIFLVDDEKSSEYYSKTLCICSFILRLTPSSISLLLSSPSPLTPLPLFRYIPSLHITSSCNNKEQDNPKN